MIAPICVMKAVEASNSMKSDIQAIRSPELLVRPSIQKSVFSFVLRREAAAPGACALAELVLARFATDAVIFQRTAGGVLVLRGRRLLRETMRPDHLELKAHVLHVLLPFAAGARECADNSIGLTFDLATATTGGRFSTFTDLSHRTRRRPVVDFLLETDIVRQADEFQDALFGPTSCMVRI